MLEVIVVDDGSIDQTYKLAKQFSEKHKNIKIIKQKNSGKAAALNNGIKNYSTGELIMCLDADSILSKDAIKNFIPYFEDQRVQAVASNVKIIPSTGILNLIQQVEYIVCYSMKKAQTAFNIEYIIGGIGSTFRKDFIESINYYDGNTVTEDIDLTMKILKKGNRNTRVIYADDVITYTQGVLDIKGLVKQRFRWKWGRLQAFYKNREMFFTLDKRFTKPYAWVYLPYAIFSDIAFIFEPLMVGTIFFSAIVLGDHFVLLSAFLILTFYTEMHLLGEQSISNKKKAKYFFVIPFMYLLFYVLSYVEYVALVKSIIKLPLLKKSLTINKNVWQHVERVSY